MKLKQEDKFIIQDDDNNLILITEIEFDFNVLQNRIIPMKGVKFEVDYENNTIIQHKKVGIQTSFSIDGIYKESV